MKGTDRKRVSEWHKPTFPSSPKRKADRVLKTLAMGSWTQRNRRSQTWVSAPYHKDLGLGSTAPSVDLREDRSLSFAGLSSNVIGGASGSVAKE